MKFFSSVIWSSFSCIFLTLNNTNANAFVKTQTSFTENFSNTSNEGGWTFGRSYTIEVDEHVGSYLYVQDLDTWAPILHTNSASNLFVGDYRARNITALNVQTNWRSEWFNPLDQRPLSLVLIHGNYAAYKLSSQSLQNAHLNWETYHFQLPTSSAQLQELGWKVVEWPQTGVEADPSHLEEILSDVQQVRFYYGDPALCYYFQYWTIGVTNISIVWNNFE